MEVKEIGELVDMGSWQLRITGVKFILYSAESLDGERRYEFHDSGRVRRTE